MTQPSSHYDFGQIASSYDSWYDTARGKMYDRFEKQAIGKLLPGHFNDSRLLEIGCGTGHWSSYFGDKGFEVTGIDVSAEMINIASQKRLPNSRFEIADGRNLAFENESFDAAVAITVLEFTTEPEKIVSEMVRCVKKSNGVLIVGILNVLSGYNQKRKNKSGSIYSSSHLFSPQQIYKILNEYGKVELLTTGFLPEKDWLLWASPLWEYLGHIFYAQQGAFIAARVDL